MRLSIIDLQMQRVQVRLELSAEQNPAPRREICYNSCMQIEILAIGNEILRGSTVNTNAAYLARQIADLGLTCAHQSVISDDLPDIASAIRRGLERSDLLILTGGLGPTEDDRTLAGVALALDVALKRHSLALQWIRERYAQANRPCPKGALRQADIPDGATPLENPLGSACGIWHRVGKKSVVALPGVPYEMRAIFEKSVRPRLKRRKTSRVYSVSLLRTVGMAELDIQRRIRQFKPDPQIEIGLYPQIGAVDIRLSTFAKTQSAGMRRMAALSRELKRSLGNACYATEPLDLAIVIGRLLQQKKQKLAIAESCTGGLIGEKLTESPGSSNFFLGGVIAYANSAKEKLLGISPSALKEYGAVSSQTACAMAQGALERLGADRAISVTGIAGPSGGSAEKPVGLVYVGYADRKRTISEKHECFGDRERIRIRAMRRALYLLYKQLAA